MSITLTLRGYSSLLTTTCFPPIDLSSDKDYVLGLILFEAFHTIPNIDSTNNKFYYGEGKDTQQYIVTIPEGAYEIDNISDYLKENVKNGTTFELRANNNTLKSEIRCDRWIHFDEANSLASLLGYSPKKLEPDIWHVSDLPINIFKVDTIRIECNITSGAYENGRLVHTVHEFFPTVPPGYKIVEVPNTIIYLPLSVHTIENVTVKISDQFGRLLNFRGEQLLVRLHVKQIN